MHARALAGHSRRQSRSVPAAWGLVALTWAGGCADSSAPAPEVRSGVLITLDTTRYDALAYLGGTGATPVLDALAREGVAYRWARTTAPITLPAHASMLTGLIPPRHTVRENHLMALPDEARTLAECARDGGLRTGAFVAAAVLDRSFGLDQGFEVYDQPERRADDAEANFSERRAADVVRAARRWLATIERGERFFLWVHCFDPHAPYDPPKAFRRAGRTPYLGEIASMDAALGALFADLRERGDYERSLIAVVADHGEALGQHGEPSHANFCYDSTVRVPFVVRHPDGWRAGAVSDAVVSVVDVFPTFVEGLGLSATADIDGQSLFRRDPDPERGVYFESFEGYLKYGFSPLAGWSDARAKYLHSSAPELYVPDEDPGEEQERSAEWSEELESYRKALAAALAQPALQRERAGGADAELMEELRTLGYVASGESTPELPSPLAPTNRPSPHARADELREVLAATSLGRKGRFVEAVQRLDAVLQANPRNAAALDYTAFFLMQMNRHAQAAERLERALRLLPDRPNTLYNLGVCRERTGDVDGALDLYRRALALDPGHVGARRDVERLADS